MATNDPTLVLVDFCRRLEAADIPYLVGGSVASSVWGEPRQTNDVDVAMWLDDESAARLPQVLGDGYVLSADAIRDALKSREEFPSFQVLEFEDGVKFDCFVQGSSPIDAEAYARARMVGIGGASIRVACAEHILVQKLRWYELGHRASERQKRDIEGIMRVATGLDWALIERWAVVCSVSDTLAAFR